MKVTLKLLLIFFFTASQANSQHTGIDKSAFYAALSSGNTAAIDAQLSMVKEAAVDEKIEDCQMSESKEAQIMRVGAELVRPGTYGVPPQKEAPKLNDRQKAVFEALQQKEGIEVSIKKDNNNIYWIVAKQKA